ncbi:MAG TPA: SDR family oxidoreductase [Thermoanaerobaculia bacterium]|jgi:NAD(P)-dependent dehydrogenase (short-subunit alcohol dehydrogenase family)|nr:SDR family oxidoreductase [Thermoanaerobaculia bacterium]
MFDPKILAERSILVTGGGSGLGLAMAKRFAAHGAKVTIAGRTLDRLEKAAEEIRQVSREGGEVDIHPADVREPAEVDGLVAHAIERFGKVDSLVNNAAGNFLVTSEDLTPNGFDAVVRTVLHGSVYCTLAVGRHLLERGAPGSIVSVVTTYAWTGTGFALPSACAKAGVLAMTRSLAVEWGEKGIRLNAVAPGPIPTEGAWSRLVAFPEAEKNTLERIPLGRFGTAEELANLVTFLLSDLCPYQTGDCVTIDGGEWLAGAGEFSDYRKIPREVFKAALERMRPKQRS